MITSYQYFIVTWFIIVSAIKKVSLIANESRASVHNKWVNFWIAAPSFRKTTKESPI